MSPLGGTIDLHLKLLVEVRTMYSQHANIRCQQRGISDDVVNVLLNYGACGHHNGADVYFMNKTTREFARRELGNRRYRRMADKLNTYVVVSNDGRIITAAKRFKRLKF